MLDPLADLLAAAPAIPQPFSGTEYSLPVQLALYGRALPTAEVAEKARSATTTVASLESALALAEAVESVTPDRAQFFLSDAKARGLVFNGAKWRAGWVLLVGGGVTDELVRAVVARDYLAFCANAPADVRDRTIPVPPRPSGMIYFLQLAVRYGMIYGRIQPGDSHELGHFLESDVPGVVVARGPLTPLESLLVLGLMKLGLPAVVPADFPYPEGRQIIAEETPDVLQAIARFPNMRVKEVDGRTIRLPDYADPVHAAEEFVTSRRLGGPSSFLLCEHDAAALDGDVVVGEGVVGYCWLDKSEVGVVVGVANDLAGDSVREFLEVKARAALRLIKGVRAAADDGSAFAIELAADTTATPGQLAETIRRSLQFQYPRLGPVSVRIILDADEVARLAPAVRRQQAERLARLGTLPGGEDALLYACTDCQPFSKEHVCFVGPTRPPMCGRDWREIEAGSLFGVGYYPYKRRADEARPNEQRVVVGRCLDPDAGEYEGVNETMRILSHGAIDRVYLHSVRGYPHTSCGCFHYLAFWIEEVGGVGVMQRGFAGRAPNGETWDSLANKAGGKQSPGVTGVGPAHLASPAFLRGDGGLAGVVWMTKRARESAGPGAAGIATEAEVQTLAELVEHLARRRSDRD